MCSGVRYGKTKWKRYLFGMWMVEFGYDVGSINLEVVMTQIKNT